MQGMTPWQVGCSAGQMQLRTSSEKEPSTPWSLQQSRDWALLNQKPTGLQRRETEKVTDYLVMPVGSITIITLMSSKLIYNYSGIWGSEIPHIKMKKMVIFIGYKRNSEFVCKKINIWGEKRLKPYKQPFDWVDQISKGGCSRSTMQYGEEIRNQNFNI